MLSAVFISPPSDLVVVQGDSARFDCGFSASVPVSISWQQDGNLILPSNKFNFLANGSLVINSTASGDAVEYTCVLTNQLTGQPVQASGSLRFAGKKF